MAAGLAIIATDVEQTSRIIIPYKTGLLVSPDSEKIAEAIIQLATDDKLREELGKNAAIFAEDKFDIKGYAKKLIQIYNNCLGETI